MCRKVGEIVEQKQQLEGSAYNEIAHAWLEILNDNDNSRKRGRKDELVTYHNNRGRKGEYTKDQNNSLCPQVKAALGYVPPHYTTYILTHI